jgi:hypothetical protein
MSAILRRVSGLLRAALEAPSLVKVGAGSGLCAGLTLGFMVSAPVGIVLGLSLGATVGIVAGIVMDRDDKRSNHRTRQLDDIIGVTSGSLGAPPSIHPPPPGDDEDAPLSLAEREAWVTEWMTPPPPHVA